MDRANKFPRYILIFIITYVSLIIAVQSFSLTDTFSALNIYCIDDAAFQTSLAAYTKLQGLDLLCMNDYGYGWLFWFPMLIITLPARILKDATGICWPLIYLPRLYALTFSVLCSVLCYRISGRYTKNEWIKLAIVILMPLYPTGGFFAGRFSTVSVVAFFSMLSLWLIIRKDTLNRQDLRWALIAFAASVGIKASAVVAAPTLALLILNRYNWKITLENCKLWVGEIFISLGALAGFASPAILLFPIAPDQAKSSLWLFHYYFEKNQALQGSFDPIAQISYSMFRWVAVILIVLLVGLAVYGGYSIWWQRKTENVWKDYVALPMGYGMGILYLSLTVHTDVVYQFMYSTAISFVLPFGLLLLGKFSAHKAGNIFIACFCTLCCVFQLSYIQGDTKINILSYSRDVANNADKIKAALVIQNVVHEVCHDEIIFLADWQSPYMACNQFDDQNVTASYVNWSYVQDFEIPGINVILLSKSAQGFLAEEAFQQQIAGLDPITAESVRQDREERTRLVQTGEFNDQLWNLAYEDEFSYLFIRADQYVGQSGLAA